MVLHVLLFSKINDVETKKEQIPKNFIKAFRTFIIAFKTFLEAFRTFIEAIEKEISVDNLIRVRGY